MPSSPQHASHVMQATYAAHSMWHVILPLCLATSLKVEQNASGKHNQQHVNAPITMGALRDEMTEHVTGYINDI